MVPTPTAAGTPWLRGVLLLLGFAALRGGRAAKHTKTSAGVPVNDWATSNFAAPPEGPVANFSVHRSLGSHMVLQRAPASATVWGFALAGTHIQTAFNGTRLHSMTGADGIWRASLPPTPAGGPYTISIKAATGETAVLKDVLFGDVFICGGQSNMWFALSANEHAATYMKEAKGLSDIRLFTVGTATSSKVPRRDLRTVFQTWGRPVTVPTPGGVLIANFSAVCWFFGRHLHHSLGGQVPIGLLSSNWPATTIEQWLPPDSTTPCGRPSTGELFNAMIWPLTGGPMAVTGFAWYQGESDLGGDPNLPNQNNNYACTQGVLIKLWRQVFKVPDAFFGVVLLLTFFAGTGANLLLAELRDQQFTSAMQIKGAAFASNEDYGFGGDYHPIFKQHVGARLANAALAITYGRPVNWKSPSYLSATPMGPGALLVKLRDVTPRGLSFKAPANANANLDPEDCPTLNSMSPFTCAWASLQFNDAARTWVNASIAIGADSMVLWAPPPPGAQGVLASSYGWGAIPMLTVYSADMDGEDGQLPVLPWNRRLAAKGPETMIGTVADWINTHVV